MLDYARLKVTAAKYDIELTNEMCEKVSAYIALLLEWNSRINLTALTDMEDIVVKHYIDSMLGARFIPKNARVIDVGTGGGFPGTALKIIRPDIDLTLMDSIAKKLSFVQLACEKCGIEADFLNLRAEEAARKPEYRECFDVATARAVAPLNTLIEYCIPLVKNGGKFISYKGLDAQNEATASQNALSKLLCSIEDMQSFVLPDNSTRTLIAILKEQSTPDIYPRRNAAIEKRPL